MGLDGEELQMSHLILKVLWRHVTSVSQVILSSVFQEDNSNSSMEER